ncbi:MAG: hypothetical protein HQ541_17655 [Mariniphaga sp.]|nr:hypothetical protein [Mariniphaga sp.]
MKNFLLLTGLVVCLVLIGCPDNEIDSFDILTTPIWQTDSLLANGIDASQPGQLLAKFKGNAIFNKDATGTFGIYTGRWWFSENRTQIVIKTDSLPLPLTCKIIELNEASFKITTAVPDMLNPTAEVKIRMTFIPK